MNRYEIIKKVPELHLHLSLKNMIDKTDKDVDIYKEKLISLLTTEFREYILEPGPKEGVHYIFRGRIVDFDERELLIDCAREGEAHIYNIPFKYIWDINDIDYVYEPDDPTSIRPLLEVVAKEWNDREELIISPEPIPLEYHSKKVGDSNE